MIRSHRMSNYWSWKIYLCVAPDATLQDILKYFNKKEGLHLSSSDYDTKPPCFISEEHEQVGIICINEWKFDAYHVGVIAHELMHLIITISEVCHCDINDYTTECWAYTMDSFMESFINVLNKKYLKENKDA